MNIQNLQLMPVANTADMDTWNDVDDVLSFGWLLNRRGGVRLERSFDGKRNDDEIRAVLRALSLEIDFELVTKDTRTLVASNEDCMVVVLRCMVRVNGPSLEVAEAIAAAFEPCFVLKEVDASRIHMEFVCHSRFGPSRQVRAILAPSWEAIAGNYFGATQKQLAALMDVVKPNHGRLVVLSGAPGTGKTTAIRALARAWSPWCKACYVLDPERFFDDPMYMNAMLSGADADDDDEQEGDEPRKWIAFIVEDADEYVTADSKSKHGRAVSRALNLLDGMMGQGLNLLMILTANLEDGDINEAFARPGRCLAEIEVGRLDHDEAEQWAREHGIDPGRLTEIEQSSIGFRRRQGYSIAELFGLRQEAGPAEAAVRD